MGRANRGLVLDPGQRFRVELTNALEEETLIHWHGQIPPNEQDGVPNLPMPLLTPGETRSYDYTSLPGTFWMHSHVPVQEMSLLAAPLIVRRPEDLMADRQEVVMFLHDFAFKPAEEVLAEITNGGRTSRYDPHERAKRHGGHGSFRHGHVRSNGRWAYGHGRNGDGPERFRFRRLSCQ